MDAASAREYFWGCNLTSDKPTVEWTFEEEDEDRDFFSHTLFLKSAVLGADAKDGEVNIIEVETKNFEDSDIHQAIASLTAGQNNMCLLDVSFDHRIPVKFTLKAGTGPVSLAAQHLVEFPDESQEFGGDETELDTEVEEEEVAALESSKKRKASKALKNGVKSKRGKMDSKEELMEGDEDDDNDEENDENDEDDMSEDDEDDMSEDDEEEVESSPDMKKAKKGKNTKIGTMKVIKKKKNEATKKGKASPGLKKAKKQKGK